MLARYGNETACGGAVFQAFIRPMRFRNGEGRNTPDDSAGGMRFSYVGPAAHKLAVGGTVTSDGADYAVKRCETVRLAGEELFVRAVLARLSPAAETDVRLERDGKTIAHVESYAAEALCSAEAVVPWGESGPAEIAEGEARWKITLTGLRAENGSVRTGRFQRRRGEKERENDFFRLPLDTGAGRGRPNRRAFPHYGSAGGGTHGGNGGAGEWMTNARSFRKKWSSTGCAGRGT
jgi:hypothetical protein